jgi:hypothetical protein
MMKEKLSKKIEELLKPYFEYSFPIGFSTLMDEVDEIEERSDTR